MRYRLVISLILIIISMTASAWAQGRIVGRVVDHDSKSPIDSAMVILAAVVTPGTSMTAVMTRTDHSGAFRFDTVTPGRYRLQATKPGMATAADASSDIVVALDGDETTTVSDLVLQRGGTISGRILDAKGEPVAAIAVHAEPVTRSPPALAGVVSVQTDGVGRFRMTGVPAGEFYLVAGATPVSQSTPDTRRDFIATYYPGTPELARATTVKVSPGESVERIEFMVQRGTLFSVSGVVVDETGAAVHDVSVTVAPEAGTVGNGGLTRVAPDGTFTIAGLQPGTYRISVMRFDLPSVSAPSRDSGLAVYRLTSPTTPIAVDRSNLTGLRVVVGAVTNASGDQVRRVMP